MCIRDRYIDDGDLDSDFHTQTRPVIADAIKQRLRQPHDAICLRLAAKEDGLETSRQSCERIGRIEPLRGLELSLRYDAIIARHQTLQTRRPRQKRIVTKGKRAQ